MDKLIKDLKSLNLKTNEVFKSEVSDTLFFDYARSIVSKPNSGLLLSGGDLDCSRYSIAGWEPFLVVKAKGRTVTIQKNGGKWEREGDPLEILDEVFSRLKPDFPLVIPPFSGGAMGYLAYELKNIIESLPQTTEDDLGLPDLFLFFPQKILVHDRQEKRLSFLELSERESGKGLEPLAGCCSSSNWTDGLEIWDSKSNFLREDYLKAVSRIRRYIKDGDVYQVNLSQRFSFSYKGDPVLLFKRLFNRNPAPFYAFINAGDHEIISTSMERFLYRKGPYIETRPIKGTRARGMTLKEDQAQCRALKESPKDDAELSMIVDLLRNDLGRVCDPRSIRVAEHKRLEAYQNVFHLVSIITGGLPSTVLPGDLIRATFPGGSITGCPKIRSMEIIDELEPHVRHVYTGAIGYLGWHENLDLNIAIRTAIHQGDKCYFSVGGAVVYDSDEEEEFQETLDKGQTFFNVVQSLKKEFS
ncbi:MAG: aminodeoxychorismate synthase component I [Candidatus Adiutricales bacterium]